MGIWKKLRRQRNNKILGKTGEQAVAEALEHLHLWRDRGRVLRNVYVPWEDGGTAEIDLLFLTRKGIFVLESKNYAGAIRGREEEREWTESRSAGQTWYGSRRTQRHTFYNPIWQNRTHLRALEQYLDRPVRCFSVVVFSDRCGLRGVEWTSPDLAVCRLERLKRTIRRLRRGVPRTLSGREVKELWQELAPLSHQSRAVQWKHASIVKQARRNDWWK